MAHRRKATADITIQQRVGLFLRLYAELKKEPYSQRTQMSITFSPAIRPASSVALRRASLK